MSNWNHRAVCKKCGWHTEAPFADLFHVFESCCPYCGNEKPRWKSYSEDWDIKVMRSVTVFNNLCWYKPRTWIGRKSWEIKS